MTRKPEVQRSSGNVFAGLALPDAEELLTKSQLAARIAEAIASRRLTQVAAAAVLGVDQPKVSALLRGRLAGFSIDRLLRFLTALDRDIDIVVRSRRSPRGKGRVQVIAARSHFGAAR